MKMKRQKYHEVKKILSARCQDFINNNWFITIVGGVIVTVIVGLGAFLIRVNVSQEIHNEKISNIEKEIETLKKSDNDKQSGLSTIKQNFEIFKVEVSKDLEFIKKKIKF